ncbi:MAG TPA: YqiA/YcfP family alpha/beta fold hydrolase, partial [Albitalea sp.]|nr:YqiA/YcfP family alpha/beta fold hydrolase [Albitalea sp.]
PERYFALIAKGDEVLDWREMSSRYAGCRIKLLEGGDHALSDFDAHLPDVRRFLTITN